MKACLIWNRKNSWTFEICFAWPTGLNTNYHVELLVEYLQWGLRMRPISPEWPKQVATTGTVAAAWCEECQDDADMILYTASQAPNV